MDPEQKYTLPFYVGKSPTLKIRGLIANRKIAKGEIIESCPVLLIDMDQEPDLKKTVLWKYYYEWDAGHHCIVLGYGSLYNHSYTPNAKYVHNFRRKVMVYTAIKNIKKGEEITINYNYFPDSQDPLDEVYLDFNKHKPG
jgi:SET domain-containing protein